MDFIGCFMIDKSEIHPYLTEQDPTKGEIALNPNYKCRKNGCPITEACQDTSCEWRLKNEAFKVHGCLQLRPFYTGRVGEMMGVTENDQAD